MEAVSWGCLSLHRMQSGSSGKTLGVEADLAAVSAGYKQCRGSLGPPEGEAADISVQPSFSKSVVSWLFTRSLLWKASDLKVWGQSVRSALNLFDSKRDSKHGISIWILCNANKYRVGQTFVSVMVPMWCSAMHLVFKTAP